MKRGTLIAIGVFVVLLVVVLATREREVNVGVPKLTLPSIDKAQVVGLETSGASSAQLKKEEGAWWVVDPRDAARKYPAEESQVTAALDALADFKATDFVSERPEKHAELELDEAKGLRVKVTGAGGPLLDVVFGKGAKSGGTYVREGKGSAVFITRSGLAWMARKDLSGWRKRALVSVSASDVAKLSVRHADGATLGLSQGEGGAWRLEEGSQTPAGFRFDASAAQRVAQQLSSLSAQDFLDASAASDELLGLAPPQATVEAQLKDGKLIKVQLGRPADSQDASRAGVLQGQLDALDEAGGQKDGKLSRADLEKAAADASRPEDVRKAARALLDDAAAFARFDVGLYAGKAKDDAIGSEDLAGVVKTAHTVPARLEGDAQVYLLPSYAAQALAKRVAELRDLSLVSFDPQQATKVVITAGGKKTIVAKEGDTWKLVEPKSPPAGVEFEPSQVPVALESFRSARATRLVEGVKDDKAGLSKPSASLEVTVPGGVQALKFGAEQTSPTGSKELFVKGSIDGFTYAIDPYLKTRLETGVELFKKPPPPPDFNQLRGLESLPPDVRRQLEAQLRQRQQ